jgi:tetratricopeptide (TPR) repeat protein
MKTKEISFTLPFVIALYEFSFFDKSYASKIRTSNFKKFLYLLPYIFTLLIIPLSLIGPNLGINKPEMEVDLGMRKEQLWNITANPDATLPRYEYFITQFRVIVTYIRLLFLPVNQSVAYDYPVFNSFLNPQVFLSFLFLLFILVSAVYLFYRPLPHSILRLTSFGIFWFFITLSIESSIIPLKKDVINEHRVYLPSVGIIMALASIMFYIFQTRLHSSQTMKKVNCLMLAAIILSLSAATYHRNNIWKDSISLFEDAVKKAPRQAAARSSLGIAYTEQMRLDEAIREYIIAARLAPNIAQVHFNLGYAYALKGQLNDAIQEYEIALRLKPSSYFAAKVHSNIGIAYYTLGHLNEAIHEFKTVLSLNPNFAEAYYNLGIIYTKKGFIREAMQEFQMALQIAPHFIEARQHLEALKSYYQYQQ